MKRITIKDLAKMLNLSISTISRALNNHPDISEETKLRVQETARQFNYRTNLQARFFRKKHSGLIALVLPEVNMFYSPSLIDGVNKAVADSPYSLVIFQTNNDLQQEKEIINQCIRWAVEGVMISVTESTNSLEHIRELEFANIKCLLIDRVLREKGISSYTINNQLAGEHGVNMLMDQGHQNILGIFGSPKLDITQERITGYRNASRKKRLPVLEKNILTVEKVNMLKAYLPDLLKDGSVTGIFTMSDELLFYTLNILKKIGISYPEDISIVSISDGILPNQTYPKVSYIEDSGYSMGMSATKELINDIQHKKENNSSNVIYCKAIIRDSVKSMIS